MNTKLFLILLIFAPLAVTHAQTRANRTPPAPLPRGHEGEIEPYIRFAYEDIRPNRRYQMPSAYSATFILRKNGMMDVQKVYVDGPRWRADQIFENGEILTLVMRDDVQSGYATKTGVPGFTRIEHSEQSTKNPVRRLILPLYADNRFKTNDSEAEFIGTNVVQRLQLDTKAGKAVLWVDRATWYPVRLMSEDGSMVIDFKDFKPGRQNLTLFEIPVEDAAGAKPKGKK